MWFTMSDSPDERAERVMDEMMGLLYRDEHVTQETALRRFATLMFEELEGDDPEHVGRDGQ